MRRTLIVTRKGRLFNSHVMAVIENEWAQLIRNRVVVFTTTIPTLLLVLLAIATLFFTRFLDVDQAGLTSAAGSLLQSIPGAEQVLFEGADQVRATFLAPFIVLFQVIPLVVPIT